MPFEMTIPAGVVAYTAGAAQEVDGAVVAPLTEYGSGVVAAGVPVVLAAEAGTYVIGVGGEAVEPVGENKLGGVLKSQSVNGSNVYRLTGSNFIKRAATSGSIDANTAYYTSDVSASSIALQKGETTSIEGVVTADGNVKFYDLKGNLVEKPVRGIYVTSEGKKVLVY